MGRGPRPQKNGKISQQAEGLLPRLFPPEPRRGLIALSESIRKRKPAGGLTPTIIQACADAGSRITVHPGKYVIDPPYSSSSPRNSSSRIASSKKRPHWSERKVAILTIIGVEHEAFRKAFGFKSCHRKHGSGRLWFEKSFTCRLCGRVTLQLHVVGNAGTHQAAAEAASIIHRHGARFLLLCGIAGGQRGKVRIGDVILPKFIADTTQKIIEQGKTKHRPKIVPLLKAVSQMNASETVRLSTWRSLLRKSLGRKVPKPSKGGKRKFLADVAALPRTHDYAIASDNLLVRDAKVLDALNVLHQQIRNTEMEAAGFIEACAGEHPQIPWYVMRAISDFADSEKSNALQPYAAMAVATYARLYLEHVFDLGIWDS